MIRTFRILREIGVIECDHCRGSGSLPNPTAGLDAENARLQERIDWLFDTLLIEHFGCGFDMYVRAPVPGWFLDELAQRWAKRDGGSVDDYREGLAIEGWMEETLAIPSAGKED